MVQKKLGALFKESQVGMNFITFLKYLLEWFSIAILNWNYQ